MAAFKYINEIDRVLNLVFSFDDRTTGVTEEIFYVQNKNFYCYTVRSNLKLPEYIHTEYLFPYLDAYGISLLITQFHLGDQIISWTHPNLKFFQPSGIYYYAWSMETSFYSLQKENIASQSFKRHFNKSCGILKKCTRKSIS